MKGHIIEVMLNNVELTANEAEAYLIDGQLEKKAKEKGNHLYIKYQDRRIGCTYILDNTRQGSSTGQKEQRNIH